MHVCPSADVLEPEDICLIMIQPGSIVRFARMPKWVVKLPDESRCVFEFCFGRTYRIEAIDEQGLFVLDVSADVDERFGGFMNDIWLEAEFLDVLDEYTAS